MKRVHVQIVFLLTVRLLASASATCQTPGTPPQHTPDFNRPQGPLGNNREESGIENGVRATMEARRQKAIAEDRHKRMVADAEKLVALANEIKAEVDKTTKDELSVTVLKKTAEMEKLARDIRSRIQV